MDSEINFNDLFAELYANEYEEMLRISNARQHQDWIETQDWINSL